MVGAIHELPLQLPMKLLVANRGEIACRIFETCRLMGIQTVAVYAEDDASSLHVKKADEAHLLTGSTLKETYLNQDQIISIAKKAKATLIHPGYGFLSENSFFAQAVIKNKIAWIGAPPEAILKMGSKIESKHIAEKVKVPTLPWKYFEDTKNLKPSDWIREAKKIGFPLLVKASGGGGGRGMRLIHQEADLLLGIESAIREASASFGDPTVFLEKFLDVARHIEVQILSDSQGHHLHLETRECSVQRRHQKIIEEAPAPRLSPKVRKSLYESAVKLAKAIQYVGAGTMEFMVDEKENFYFLEMNTRLQVEHPVTEWITGIDIVREQIHIALGQKLTFSQDEIKSHGHAMECRIYAEDPHHGFVPTPGPIDSLYWPTTRNTRIDTGIVEGDKLTSQYDPLVAKVTTWGANREEARSQMNEALSETTLLGFTHNISFLKQILNTNEFKNSKIATRMVEQSLIHKIEKAPSPAQLAEIIALLFKTSSQQSVRTHQQPNLYSTIKF